MNVSHGSRVGLGLVGFGWVWVGFGWFGFGGVWFDVVVLVLTARQIGGGWPSFYLEATPKWVGFCSSQKE